MPRHAQLLPRITLGAAWHARNGLARPGRSGKVEGRGILGQVLLCAAVKRPGHGTAGRDNLGRPLITVAGISRAACFLSCRALQRPDAPPTPLQRPSDARYRNERRARSDNAPCRVKVGIMHQALLLYYSTTILLLLLLLVANGKEKSGPQTVCFLLWSLRG